MNDARPILILTASAGAGHTVAAEALEQSLRDAAPELDVEIHDVLNSTNAFFRTLYAQGYLGLVNHAPTAMGLLYEATDRPNQRVRDGLRSAFQNINARRTMRLLIERENSDIITFHSYGPPIHGKHSHLTKDSLRESTFPWAQGRSGHISGHLGPSTAPEKV